MKMDTQTKNKLSYFSSLLEGECHRLLEAALIVVGNYPITAEILVNWIIQLQEEMNELEEELDEMNEIDEKEAGFIHFWIEEKKKELN
jgi:hypothetical protein